MTDCIVIGAGLSGVSAALTLAQHHKRVELIATSTAETRAAKLAVTTPYPGGSTQATGQSLMEHVLDQLRETRATITTGTAQTLTKTAEGFELTLAAGEKKTCKTVIVATGLVHHGHTALVGEDAFFGKGLFYQMQVDGPMYTGKILVAAGKTPAIIEELITYHRLFEKTYLVVPAAKLEIPEPLQERLQRSNSIEVVYSASVKEIQGLAGIGSVIIQAAGQDRQLHAQAVWLPTHTHFGNTGFLEGVAELSDTKTPLVSQQLATNIPGLFACGDVLCAQHQHPSITAAQGIVAAYSCINFLTKP